MQSAGAISTMKTLASTASNGARRRPGPRWCDVARTLASGNVGRQAGPCSVHSDHEGIDAHGQRHALMLAA